MAGDIAREHDIAGPEQRSQAEQQVRLVVEPAERGMMLRLSGQCGRICAGMGELSKVARRIGDMRSAAHSLSSWLRRDDNERGCEPTTSAARTAGSRARRGKHCCRDWRSTAVLWR